MRANVGSGDAQSSSAARRHYARTGEGRVPSQVARSVLRVDVHAVAQLAPELAEQPERFGERIVLVDRLVVHLGRADERLVGEVGVHVERAREDPAHDVFDELRIVMRFVDDEELVRPLEQIVGLARHRVLDDLDQIFGPQMLARTRRRCRSAPSRGRAGCASRPAARRARGWRRLSLKPASFEFAQRMLAHHQLRARTGRHAFGFDADERGACRARSACAIPTSV